MDDTLLASTLRDGGARAVIAASASLAPADRVALLARAIRTVAFGRDWPAHYVDEMAALGDEAIEVALASGDENEANRLSFNVSANLCDCWGDPYTRTTSHFERGLAHADRALALRRKLGAAPDKIAMAEWARGKHLLSLGRFADAVAAFEDHGASLSETDHADPCASLAADAYLATAREAAGETSARSTFDVTMRALRSLAEDDPGKAEDAKVYVDQLVATRTLLGLPV